MQHVYSGKVREIYTDGDDLLLVASDRVSVYDVVLPTPIPDKGALLTQLSVWWFGQLADIVPNHLVSATDVPAEFEGRAIRCRRLEMVPFECIARGYLAGSGLKEYQATGAISGVPLPRGLVEGSRLPEPIFTPTTKVSDGGHDAPATFEDVAAAVGLSTATRLRDLTLEVYRRGAARAAANGIIVADTKLEFGIDAGRRADAGRRGADPGLVPLLAGRRLGAGPRRSTRTTSSSCGTGRRAPGGTRTRRRRRSPPTSSTATRARYVDAYEKITGLPWRG